MRFDSPERIKALVTAHPWHGETLHFRKVTVSQWRDLVKDREQRVKSEDADKDGFDWFALLLSKHLCDEAGNLTHDSDEKRAEFNALSPDELAELGLAALGWSGLHGEKKS